jgi:hypothetical protein
VASISLGFFLIVALYRMFAIGGEDENAVGGEVENENAEEN